MANLLKKKSLRHVQILTGVRRCGKSTIFKLLINDLLGEVDAKSVLVLNLDAPQFIPVWSDASQIMQLVERAESLTGVKVDYLFLDEIQQVKDWEVFVKNVYDLQRFRKIYITGSNSNLLQGRFAALLSGRYFENELRPFSVKEALSSVCGIGSLLEAYQRMPDVLRCMERLNRMGCFPEILLGGVDEDVCMELLRSYFDSIVQKDCIIYNGVRDTALFYRFTNYLFQNVGHRFSVPQLAKSLKSNENTISPYLGYLCDSYICTDVRNFSYSQKETKRSDHKCYCIDNGLVAANTLRYTADTGLFFENLVFNEIINHGYEALSFANGKGECDFLAVKDGVTHAFQVCYELTEGNRERELRGFDVPKTEIASKTLLTFNQKETVGDVRILPLWEWALGG